MFAFADTAPYGDNWHLFNGVSYRFDMQELLLADARAKCQADGGDLVKVETADEDTFIQGVVYQMWQSAGFYNFFIGESITE